jgi:hypothetical protein
MLELHQDPQRLNLPTIYKVVYLVSRKIAIASTQVKINCFWVIAFILAKSQID